MSACPAALAGAEAVLEVFHDVSEDLVLVGGNDEAALLGDEDVMGDLHHRSQLPVVLLEKEEVRKSV